jgi:hypothetical protein
MLKLTPNWERQNMAGIWPAGRNGENAGQKTAQLRQLPSETAFIGNVEQRATGLAMNGVDLMALETAAWT